MLRHAFSFCFITVFEIETLKIEPRPSRHQIDHDLSKPLLLYWITDMLKALHIKLDELNFLKLEFHLAVEQVVDDLLPIFFVANLIDLSIIELLHLCNIVTANSEELPL